MKYTYDLNFVYTKNLSGFKLPLLENFQPNRALLNELISVLHHSLSTNR